MANVEILPRVTTTILQKHIDEVWDLEWSHNGKFLASASKDRTVIIWSVAVCVFSTFDTLLHLCGARTTIAQSES